MTGIIVDGPLTNALQLGTVRRALILTITTAKKKLVGDGGEEGFVGFAQLSYPHVTASANQTT